MTKINNSLLFYLSISLILVVMYSSTWFPGAKIIEGKELYVTIIFAFVIIIFGYSMYDILNLNIKFSTIERKFLYLLFIVAALSTIKYNPQELANAKSILYLFAYPLLIIIYFFLIPKFFDNNPDFFKKFIFSTSIFGFIFAFLGLFMMLFAIYPSEFAYGFLSIIKHPNLSSKVLTVTIFPTLYYIYSNKDEIPSAQKMFLFFSVILQFLAQLLTLDRAGIIGTTVGLIVFYAFYYRSKIIYFAPVFAGMILAGASLFRAKGFASFVTRFYLLVPAFDMIFSSQDRLLWGFGITNGFAEYSDNLLVFYSNESHQTDPHNSYVTLVLFFGLVFTLALLLFFIILLYKSVRKIYSLNNKRESLIYIFMICAFVSLAIQAVFDAEVMRIDYFTVHYIFIIMGLMYLGLKKKLSF